MTQLPHSSTRSQTKHGRPVLMIVSGLIGILLWWGFVFVSAFYGWWMQPIAAHQDDPAFFSASKAIIESSSSANIAYVMIEDGKVAHEFYSDALDPIDSNTVFQTASLSKWIAATAVMKLVEEQKLALDVPVNQLLNRWQLPQSPFSNETVTVRRLLSHTAGLTDELGFGEYLPDEKIPSLEVQLASPRASGDREAKIVVGVEPGTEWRYSGGGYLILELLIEEITGMTFEEYTKQNILEPLAMTRSGYGYIGDLENHAGSYQSDGSHATLYQYGSNAATGFFTSASDLTRFVQAQTSENNGPRLLAEHTIRDMRVPHGSTLGADIWGLGTILYAPTRTGDSVYGHDGANEPAINTAARINPDTRDAIVVLSTGQPGLATQLGAAWVLWQTGTPDVLDTDGIIQSMFDPGLIGTGVILLLLIVVQVYPRLRSPARE